MYYQNQVIQFVQSLAWNVHRFFKIDSFASSSMHLHNFRFYCLLLFLLLLFGLIKEARKELNFLENLRLDCS